MTSDYPHAISMRRFSFVDSVFGHNLGDGGSQFLDFIVVPIGLMICMVLASAVGFMWTKRHVNFMRMKSMPFVILQTVGGIMWYLGFVARFGHFPRTGILHSCSFWNFYVSIMCGFTIWTTCILFRLLRLHLLFNHGKSSLFGVSLIRNPFGFIGLLGLPHAIIYGVLLPAVGAVVRKESSNQCLYSNGFWAWTDNVLFFSVWAFLLIMSLVVKDLKDGFGEVRNLRGALHLSLCTLAVTVIVEILQIDGLALGRAIVTSSVLASVCIFFVRQNGEELQRLLFNKDTLEYVSQDQAIDDVVLREENDVTECDILESSNLASSSRAQIFARTLLHNS